jgi:hypothetical protein
MTVYLVSLRLQCKKMDSYNPRKRKRFVLNRSPLSCVCHGTAMTGSIPTGKARQHFVWILDIEKPVKVLIYSIRGTLTLS